MPTSKSSTIAPSTEANFYDLKGQRQRRDAWFQAVRDMAYDVFNRDGTSRSPQFDTPHREPLWMAAALYRGPQEYIDLANRVIGRWHDGPRLNKTPGLGESHGSDFGIFQTNTLTHLYHHFRDRITPAVEKVMRVHLQLATQTYGGSGQPDTMFRGGNDNMPMAATGGLIFAGEALGDERAVRHGLWNLHQFRLLLSRAAWASEFNSSTYSLVTLAHAAQIASYARDVEVRELALQIEHRLWAEVLLHYHPGTFMQAGPQSRAYSVDYAGHTHGLQILFWLVFGPEASGRDPIRTFFHPDGKEVIHFGGCPQQSIAEIVHFIDTDFHLPIDLARLVTERNYPARHRGRTEVMNQWQVCHTQTYMEKEFSLGTASSPWANGEQTSTLHVTYQRKPQPRDFRDASTVFFKYVTSKVRHGEMERSSDGAYEGEKFISNRGWSRTLQKDNVALLSITPDLGKGPLETDTLRLDLLFPAHYGRITQTIIGDGPARPGAVGESAEVVPVSIEAGEVFIHVMPLLPTSLPRAAALRFTTYPGHYEVLELINYEGPTRTFSIHDLELAVNGVVMTVEARHKHRSLEDFHRAKSKFKLVDYHFVLNRVLEFRREDVWFQFRYQPTASGELVAAIDGRNIERPVFESNQIDVTRLPFVTGPVEPNPFDFPWKDSMELWQEIWNRSWIIGSRGWPEEKPYSQRKESIKPAKP